MDKSPSLTSVSLLGRLREDSDNEADWQAFVEQYAPRVLNWCRQCNLQQADAEDVTQTVLLKLARVMAEFEYDSTMSFRSWLKTVTQRAVANFFRQRGASEVAKGGSQAANKLLSIEAQDELLRRLRETFDMELLEAAIETVQSRVSQQRWQAYRLSAMEGLSGADVAEKLNMKVATVYTAKHKIQSMLEEEVKRLEETPASEVFSLEAGR